MHNMRKLLRTEFLLKSLCSKRYVPVNFNTIRSLNYCDFYKHAASSVFDQFYGRSASQFKTLYTIVPSTTQAIDSVVFESICDETLDSLSEYFETLIENTPTLSSADITYSDGVLTVNLGLVHGTYVINRQSPNRQIWLSSPVSGPKRYDYILNKQCWIYKHDGKSLHQLLSDELHTLLKKEVNFSHCLHSDRH